MANFLIKSLMSTLTTSTVPIPSSPAILKPSLASSMMTQPVVSGWRFLTQRWPSIATTIPFASSSLAITRNILPFLLSRPSTLVSGRLTTAKIATAQQASALLSTSSAAPKTKSAESPSTQDKSERQPENSPGSTGGESPRRPSVVDQKEKRQDPPSKQQQHQQQQQIWWLWNRAFSDHQRQQKQQQNLAVESKRYHKTRLPIVMCHGLFGFDKIGPNTIPALQMHYWSGIAESLRKTGCEVYIARVPAMGNIEERANHLSRFLEQNLRGRDVNLIAHSMGGLDARFLITHMPSKEFTIRSLTTIATPHRGSPVMDWIRDTIGVGPKELKSVRSLAGSSSPSTIATAGTTAATDVATATATAATTAASLLSRLVAPLDQPAYYNLTTEYMTQHFNPSTPDDPTVKYYSYGGAAANVGLLSPVRYTWEIVRAKEGENDGIVSVHSARWGEYVETVAADHFDLNKQKTILLDFRKFLALYRRMNVPMPRVSLNLSTLMNSFYGLPAGVSSASSGSSSSSLPSSSLPSSSLSSSSSSSSTSSAGSAMITMPTSTSATAAAARSTKATEEYQKRMMEIFHEIYGPNSYDDYIYGYDYEASRTSTGSAGTTATATVSGAKRSFDAAEFYLGTMDRLYRKGF